LFPPQAKRKMINRKATGYRGVRVIFFFAGTLY
jgi:hypothetical protein